MPFFYIYIYIFYTFRPDVDQIWSCYGVKCVGIGVQMFVQHREKDPLRSVVREETEGELGGPVSSVRQKGRGQVRERVSGGQWL